MTVLTRRLIATVLTGVSSFWLSRGFIDSSLVSGKASFLHRNLRSPQNFLVPNLGLHSVVTLRNLNIDTDMMHSEITKIDLPTVSITVIPATKDNFMYLIVDKATGDAAAVDPVEPETVIEVANKENATVKVILTTHHHWDHADGNAKFVELYTKQNGNKLDVYGGDPRVQAISNQIGQGDKIKVGNLQFDCLHTPCHTTGHICYYLKTDDPTVNPSVFTGDTLFIAGCGRFFEGKPSEMHEALITKLGALPDNTWVFCGHEYTVPNLRFSLSVEPNNRDAQEKIRWAEGQRAVRKPTVPSTIGEEKKINPFMRVTLPSMQQATGTADAIACMGQLRSTKDNFRS